MLNSASMLSLLLLDFGSRIQINLILDWSAWAAKPGAAFPLQKPVKDRTASTKEANPRPHATSKAAANIAASEPSFFAELLEAPGRAAASSCTSGLCMAAQSCSARRSRCFSASPLFLKDPSAKLAVLTTRPRMRGCWLSGRRRMQSAMIFAIGWLPCCSFPTYDGSDARPCVRIPTQEGFKDITPEEIDKHWNGVTLQDVIPKDRLDTLKQADRVKRRALYVAACVLRKIHCLDDRNMPSTKALELAQSECSAGPPAKKLRFTGAFGRKIQPKAGNFKGALQEFLQQASPNAKPQDLMSYKAVMDESGGWRVNLEVDNPHVMATSDLCPTKKAAEQDAAKKVLDRLQT